MTISLAWEWLHREHQHRDDSGHGSIQSVQCQRGQRHGRMWEQQLTVALAGVQVEAVRVSQAEAGKQADSDRGAKEALWQKLQEANQRLAAASQARPCTPCPMKTRYLLSWHLHATAWASGAT